MEKDNIRKEIKILRRTIPELKKQLIKINESKEWWFARKEQLKSELHNLISQVKKLRPGGNITENIKKLRNERDKYNKKVKELIQEINKLKVERDKAFKKHKVKFNPSQIKKKIEKLEEALEIEAYSFKKEKEVMENIKKLKKFYGEGSVIEDINKRIKEVSEQIDVSKKVADELHKRLKEHSSKGKKEFGQFRRTSKQIDKIKKEQESAFDKFIAFKKEFAQTNDLLKKRLTKSSELREKMNKLRENKNREKKEVKSKEEEKVLEEKAREVEEKLKTKKKLTTEDIIAFQGKKEDEDLLGKAPPKGEDSSKEER